MPQITQIQVRRDTASNWTSTNSILAQGEIGFETDTGKFKIGDGTTAWSSLTYATDISKGGTGHVYGSPLIGRAQLAADRNKPTNNTACEAVFVNSSGTVNYLSLANNRTYFYEGFVYLYGQASASAKTMELRFIYLDSSNNGLTPVTFSLQANGFLANNSTTPIARITSTTNTDVNTDLLASNVTGAGTGTVITAIYFRGTIQTHASTAGKMNIGAAYNQAATSGSHYFGAGSFLNVYDMGAGDVRLFGNWSL